MVKCQLKQGFFILRDCEEMAMVTCPVCKRKVCKKHSKIAKGSGTPTCLDCLGKKMQQRKRESIRDDEWDDYYYDSSWSYGYRSRYYSNCRYRPWYYGGSSFHDPYYNSYDVRSLDNRNDDGGELMDSGEDYQAEADIFDS